MMKKHPPHNERQVQNDSQADLTHFQKEFLSCMSFKPHARQNSMLFEDVENPNAGSLIKFGSQSDFALYIADYTILEAFSLEFHASHDFIRFGLVFEGASSFLNDKQKEVGLTPTSFLVLETGISGKQSWLKNMRFNGIEFIISADYVRGVLGLRHPAILTLLELEPDFVYHYLPLEVSVVLNDLMSKGTVDILSDLYLEAALLKCLAIITDELSKHPKNCFKSQYQFSVIEISDSRNIRLSQDDILAIQSAHDQIVSNLNNLPTLHALSKSVYISEQKLAAGFKKLYNMTLGQYVVMQRLQAAANLLSSSDLSIDEISSQVGYSHPSNFAKAFKKRYKKSPLQYRKGT